ncbi:MAG: hypothetical protein BWX74_00774 [Tenericutes bacterium ADurb.Bin087]|nr:MAG: hypothetical protein BWX74_00774 [Tenericutes bacterium ADurb.Bin087]
MNRRTLYNFFNKDKGSAGASLPANRWKAYFDILSHRFGTLVILSLLTALFFVPYFSINFIANLFINTQGAGVEDEALRLFRLFSLKTLLAAINIPLLIIGFIGLGGTFNVIRKLVYQDPDIRVARDFWAGVRINFGESLLAGLFFSIYLVVFYANIYFYPTVQGFPKLLLIIFMIVIIIVLVIVTSATLFMMTSATIYKFDVKIFFKNSLLLGVILIPQNILFIVIAALPLLVYYLIPFVLVQLIAIAIIVLYGFSHLALTYTLYSYSVFDKYINKTYEPKLVRLGLDNTEE